MMGDIALCIPTMYMIRTLRGGGGGNIHVQHYRTQIVANNFINKGQYHWQMIPDDIQKVNTL